MFYRYHLMVTGMQRFMDNIALSLLNRGPIANCHPPFTKLTHDSVFAIYKALVNLNPFCFFFNRTFGAVEFLRSLQLWSMATLSWGAKGPEFISALACLALGFVSQQVIMFYTKYIILTITKF
jgi:hypothetical protein